MHRTTLRQLAVAALTCAAMGSAAAATIEVTRTDLPDTTPGQDLWRSVYTFTGPLTAAAGFTLLFDATMYADLVVTRRPAELDATVTQPDAALPADGLVSLTAQSTTTSAYMAEVVVEHLLLARPAAAQPFEVFDDTFNITATGTTTSPSTGQVPEPATWALVAAAWLVARRQRVDAG